MELRGRIDCPDQWDPRALGVVRCNRVERQLVDGGLDRPGKAKQTHGNAEEVRRSEGLVSVYNLNDRGWPCSLSLSLGFMCNTFVAGMRVHPLPTAATRPSPLWAEKRPGTTLGTALGAAATIKTFTSAGRGTPWCSYWCAEFGRERTQWKAKMGFYGCGTRA